MPSAIDLTGQQFGRLTVLSRAKKKNRTAWLCQCSCGNTKIITTQVLRRKPPNGAISCGCWKRQIWQRLTTTQGDWETKNELGSRYGMLTVIAKSDTLTYGNRITWVCKCDCGNTHVVDGVRLRNGAVCSCGCDLIKPHCLPPGEANFNALYARCIAGAKRRNLTFNISQDDFRRLSQEKCFYCGCKPAQIVKSKGNGEFIYNGLDRVDNSCGYTLDNVVPCCKRCNYAKSNLDCNQFYAWVRRINNYWAKPKLIKLSNEQNQPFSCYKLVP